MSRSDKGERLIAAANELFYQQGFHISTLADIANKADVPLGNVYYYFKTKDDILKAVLQKRVDELQALFTFWEKNSNAKERLKAFIYYVNENSELKARFGCQLGTLSQELAKSKGELVNSASDLLEKIYRWLETQFKALGKVSGDATSCAEYLLAGLQGGVLASLAFKDPNYLMRQSRTLEAWLEAQA